MRKIVMVNWKTVLLILGYSILSLDLFCQTLPAGFQIETVIDDIEYPAGMVHDHEVSYVWELNGIIWPVIDGEKNSEPLLDLSDEVGFWKDHGLLSVALHPSFSENGWIYLLYVVDRHHLLNFGTSSYDPEVDQYEEATIGRVARYTVKIDDRTQIVVDSRVILIGDTKENGIPIPTISHGLGTLCFGEDGSLLISVGDGNSPGSDYNGTGELPSFGYDDQALADGILKPDENVGAFRSQHLNTLCGKVLRINPETGGAYESNPFFDPSRPDEPISKVWALGFRNPFRMSLIPNTGSTDPALGDPGSIIIGDVGDWSWEEINIINESGLNFGWPIFQGPEYYYLFENNFTADPEHPLDFPCGNFSFYTFQDLIVQPREFHDEQWTHPCGGQISTDIRTFAHERPVLAYANNIIASGSFAPEDSVVMPGFNLDGSAALIGVSSSEANIIGAEEFTGSSSVAGVFYTGESFPEEYHGIYLQADFSGWFKAFRFSESYELTALENWSNSIGNVVHISENPFDGSVYLATLFPGEIKRISFAGNLSPVIIVSPDTIIGNSPLSVFFDASETYDPEGDAITFDWDFDDGTLASGPLANHTFISEDGLPKSFRTVLTVTDSYGNSRQKTILVAVENTPPKAEIVSFSEDFLYSIYSPTSLNLVGDISDMENEVDELEIRWDIYLHHNSHFHLERTFFEEEALALIQPLGCGIETFWYRFDLTVTDPQGLTTKTSKEIFPDCDGSGGYQNDVLIFPNPTQNRFQMNYPSDPGNEVTLRIFNYSGILIRSEIYIPQAGEISRSFGTNNISSGTYVVELRGPNWVKRGSLVIIKL
ncbi:MAG: glucose/arabinose dehydrogenase [Cryomorphaceae bacterium]|jgi:glucose/arabinose dehydrogenase